MLFFHILSIVIGIIIFASIFFIMILSVYCSEFKFDDSIFKDSVILNDVNRHKTYIEYNFTDVFVHKKYTVRLSRIHLLKSYFPENITTRKEYFDYLSSLLVKGKKYNICYGENCNRIYFLIQAEKK